MDDSGAAFARDTLVFRTMGMPEPVTASMCPSSDYAKGWNDCLAALSQTAGVPEGGPGDRGDMARAWLAVTETLDDVFPQWIESEKVGRECACDAIRFLAGRSRLAAAPAASGGEDGPNWRYTAVSALEYLEAGDTENAIGMLKSAISMHVPQPPAAASVSERARDDLHVAICQAVALMNMEPMTTAGLLQAHDILRKAIS